MSDLHSEILQHLIDKLREETKTDYIYADTRLDKLPGDVIIEVLEKAVECFADRAESPATVADLADVVVASARLGVLAD